MTFLRILVTSLTKSDLDGVVSEFKPWKRVLGMALAMTLPLLTWEDGILPSFKSSSDPEPETREPVVRP